MNNKRWPLIATFLLFIALCASAAYWALQFFQPPPRPVAAPPRAAAPQIQPQAAAALFGGRANAAVASNYQLRGVIYAGNPLDSVAILSTDGKPAQAIRAGTEIVPGVTVKEVHRGYVLIAEGGAVKRVELPETAERSPAVSAPVPSRPVTPPPAQPTPPAPAPAPPPQQPPAVAPQGSPQTSPPTDPSQLSTDAGVPGSAAAARAQRGFSQGGEGAQDAAQMGAGGAGGVVVNRGEGAAGN